MADGAPLRLFHPVIHEEAIVGVADALRSGWIGCGPRTREFEETFAKTVDAPHCVALNSCTTALRLALRVLDLPPGTEVVTSPLTFVSANQAILEESLTPVFADVQTDTGSIDPHDRSLECITERTGAVMVMHYGGTPCDLDEIYELGTRARRGGGRGLRACLRCLVPRAPHRLARRPPCVLLPGGQEPAARRRRCADGCRRRTSTRDCAACAGPASTGRHSSGARVAAYRWEYDVTEVGVKGAMNDITAAIGLGQLPYLEADNQRRREIAELYRAGLSGTPGLELLREHDDRVSSGYLFCVLADDRDRLVESLAASGIDVGVHFRPSYSTRCSVVSRCRVSSPSGVAPYRYRSISS